MKNLRYFALLLMFITTASLASPLATVDVVNTKYKNLFVFKVKNKFRGADVQVFYSNGDLVTSQKLEKRKMIINFCDVKYGTYTIKVQKGNKAEEFNYIKK